MCAVGSGTTLPNTIVVGNTSSGAEVSGTFTDNGGNFASGNASDFFASLSGSGGALADNGGPVHTVALEGDPSNPALDVGSGGAADARGEARFDMPGVDNDPGGTGIVDSGAYEFMCFATGTRIATPDGETRVEALGIGDEVTNADGTAVRVRWLGVQTLRRRIGLLPEAMQPVRIRAGALGNGVPYSDLTVTADHGLVIDRLVINAGALLNGISIEWVPMAELPASFTVYNVETEAHDVIFANGAPAETFVDYAGRQAFDNCAEDVELHGAERLIPEMDRPRISSQRLVPDAIKARLGMVEPEIDWEAPLAA